MKVKELIVYLNERIPFGDAEAWDKPGMIVGSPEDEIAGIACALDATPTTIQKAHEIGCNVLVTHHPVFIEAPNAFTNNIKTSALSSVVIWQAISKHISIISLHTNLDRSEAAHDYLANLLGFTRVGRLEEPDGYGVVMSCGGIGINELCKRCASVFNTEPIAWGFENPHEIKSIAYCSGSCGDLGTLAIKKGIDCVICGECGYHKLLEMDEAGVRVVVLGHDASEKPFANLLADILSDVVSDSCISVLDEPRRWRVLA